MASTKPSIRTFSNPLISNFQSALSEVLADSGAPSERLAAEHPHMQALCEACDELMPPDHAHESAEKVTAPALAKQCAQLYVGLLRAKMMNNRQRIAEIEDEIRFSVCDPLWAKVLLEYRKSEGATIPYRRYTAHDDFVESMPNEPLTIAFVSDWGTGTPTARNVLRNIADHRPDIFIHLGDVYYSGTRREMDENFLRIVRQLLPQTTVVRALAGNHDLYAGGEGYYWLLDEIDQAASYFCLRNDHWQLLAVGAPPEKADPTNALSSIPIVDEAEVVWHQHKLATAGGRKTIMLSHYPLFTASGNIGRTVDKRPLALNPVLYDAFCDYLTDIDLWLWGHEHNLVAFDPYLGLEKGRCIGSGAIPVPLLWQPYKTLPDLALPEGVVEPPHIRHDIQLGHDGDHYHHGYAVLTLTGSVGQLAYYEVAGVDSRRQLIKSEWI